MKVKNLVLSAEDLCKIIEKCASSGVMEFKAGDLSICFDGLKRWNNTLVTDVPAPRVTDEQPHIVQETLAKESRLEQMLIEDPLQYEKLIAQGELDEET